MHSTTFYTCASISTDTIHVHSNARRYWLAALSIWILKNQHHKRRWPRETRTRRRVILDLNYLQKKPTPLSRKSSATSGITHHQIFPTNQQKVSSHHQSVQSLPSGGRTIPPPLASTWADMPRPSAGAPWHLTRHTCDVASTPCQHRCWGHHVAVTKSLQGHSTHNQSPLYHITPFLLPPPPPNTHRDPSGGPIKSCSRRGTSVWIKFCYYGKPKRCMDQHAGTTSTNSQTGKQVFIGAGLPILPKCLIDKMRNWEYINFNELIRFCDPGAEEEHDLNTNPDHYLFHGLGVIQRGHKLTYSFTQWANCFITYIAALASSG